jgi:ABC-2 type transport system permease protein
VYTDETAKDWQYIIDHLLKAKWPQSKRKKQRVMTKMNSWSKKLALYSQKLTISMKLLLNLKTQKQFHFWLEFLIAMTEKEIKARYKHALLGFLWIILNPIIQMLIIGFVFQFFIPVEVDNYFLFLFAGLLPWNFFAYSLTKTVPSIVYERSLIQKAKFPRESIVLSIVLSNAFHFVISLGLFLGLILLLVTTQTLTGIEIIPSINFFDIWKWLLLLPLLVWILLLTSGFSLLGAALNVKYRDVSFVVSAFVPMWFYATPVVYTLDLLPRPLQFIAYLNPMTGITELFHWILLSIPVTSVNALVLSFIVTILSVGIGWHIFFKESPFFDDWI